MKRRRCVRGNRKFKCARSKSIVKIRVSWKECYPIFPPPPKRCHKRRPRPRPCPVPIIQDPNLVIEKESCGNILIQGNQPGFHIWESNVEACISVTQVSIYSNPNSTDAIEVEINGDEKKQLVVLPGNTISFLGQGITSVIVSTKGNELTYVEGKYAISYTIDLRVS